MTTTNASSAIQRPWSDWDVEELDTLHPQTSAAISNNPDPRLPNRSERCVTSRWQRRMLSLLEIKQCCTSTFFQGLLVGLLVGAVAFAVVLSLWMTSNSKNGMIAQPAPSTSTSTANNTTNGTASSASTTSATSTSSTSSSSLASSTSSSSLASSTSSSSSITSTITTTAFTCSSAITSTLNSYTKTDCPKNGWHTFTNSFVASSTGTQTLIFSFTNLYHAIIYLTNVQINDTSNIQLLTNGDFSSSNGTTPTDWLQCSSSGQVSSACAVNTSVACYTDSAPGGTISQSFSVISGTNYTLTFDLYHVSCCGAGSSINLDVAVV